MTNKRKIINDPVYGFLTIDDDIIFDVISHRWFQRQRHIKQLGFTYLVYPGAVHSRFSHMLGALNLMKRAIDVLRSKGVEISHEEALGVQLAILLHDIGHGPFSHTSERVLCNVHHERLTQLFMEGINKDFDGRLQTAIEIFEDRYPRHFLHQLVSSQLDMDRLDYLGRDSFFTGVSEGIVGTERIINMLNVADDRLVVDEKGIYSVEKFIISRRLMYWQVYLHRTCVAYEKVLVNMLTRAKDLIRMGQDVFASPALHYFISNDVDKTWFTSHPEALAYYGELDDSDIWSAMKAWKHHDDKILSTLATDMLDRRIFKVEVLEEEPTPERIDELKQMIAQKMDISYDDAHYLMSLNTIQKDMYNVDDDSIAILYKNGEIKDISEASELLNVQLLSKKIRKYYLCYQRFE